MPVILSLATMRLQLCRVFREQLFLALLLFRSLRAVLVDGKVGFSFVGLCSLHRNESKDSARLRVERRRRACAAVVVRRDGEAEGQVSGSEQVKRPTTWLTRCRLY